MYISDEYADMLERDQNREDDWGETLRKREEDAENRGEIQMELERERKD